MNETEPITGTVVGVRDYGTLVVLYLDAGEGRVIPIPMEHRPFQRLLEGERCAPGDLVGRTVSFDGDTVRFLDGG
jgi:hypothetical protein